MTNYLWSNGETTSDITVHTPGLYTVTVTEGNCQATASYTIDMCEFNLFLPNAITPGKGDGLNDYFSISERDQNQIYDFNIYIYNRWGELVFHSTDKNFKWNGEVNGQTPNNIIYNYVIQCSDILGNKKIFKGSITVL